MPEFSLLTDLRCLRFFCWTYYKYMKDSLKPVISFFKSQGHGCQCQSFTLWGKLFTYCKKPFNGALERELVFPHQFLRHLLLQWMPWGGQELWRIPWVSRMLGQLQCSTKATWLLSWGGWLVKPKKHCNSFTEWVVSLGSSKRHNALLIVGSGGAKGILPLSFLDAYKFVGA